MATLVEYGQGATIGFYIEGDSVIDLDANDFKILYYKKNMVERALLLKSDLTQISVNKYYGEIDSDVTATMTAGTYIQEILYGATYHSISKENCFIIYDTEIKSEL